MKPPNSLCSSHYIWNRASGGFPSFLKRETSMTVLEEKFKLHPPPEEDLEMYLFSSPGSFPVDRLVKERLPPILRTFSILNWHLEAGALQEKTVASSSGPLSLSRSPLSSSSSYFSPPSPSTTTAEAAESAKRASVFEQKWMVDEEQEMFIANQFSADDDFFTVL